MEINNNKKTKIIKQNFGFTMIEILVVIGILGVIATIGTSMFFTTFRSSTKTKILSTVKQNGDYALSVMERIVRDSQEVIANTETPSKTCEVDMKKIKVKRLDGSEIEFSCEEAANSFIASNSAALTSSEVKLDSCYFDCITEGDFYPQNVVIRFTLSQATATTRSEEQAKVDFRTTITLRNF